MFVGISGSVFPKHFLEMLVNARGGGGGVGGDVSQLNKFNTCASFYFIFQLQFTFSIICISFRCAA